jgi:hypothetical protein
VETIKALDKPIVPAQEGIRASRPTQHTDFNGGSGLSRGLQATPRASLAVRRAGALLALGMLLYAASAATTDVLTVLVLLLATVVCAAANCCT